MSLKQDCWNIHPQTGFLLHPRPLRHVGAEASPLPEDAITLLESTADHLVQVVESRTVPALLQSLQGMNWHQH
ncbi:MAG: hypothetical protein KC496_03000, partial [Anaerolineae bacterium]|nr:hypothetical protein [Anaerolineae bacterium]